MAYKPSEFPADKLPPTIFNMIEVEIAKRASNRQKVIGLHVGDANLDLPGNLKSPIPGEKQHFGSNLNRYGNTYGEPPLLKLLLLKIRLGNMLPFEDIDSIQITAGATGALQAGFSRLLHTGAEILTLSPYWSILRQVADQAKVNLIEVPFWDRITGEESFDLTAHFSKFLSPNTEAIYLNTPSNPTGMVLDEKTLHQIGEFAEAHDLWIFSDEAYEDFIYDKRDHISIGSLPGMTERVISIFTMSKCFGASGLRVGYAVARPPIIAELNRGVVGGYYEAGRYDQQMAWRGMQQIDKIVAKFKSDYMKAWDFVRTELKAESMPSIAGFYFFIKVPDSWIKLSPGEKVSRMLDLGVVLSPGEYFGNDYRNWLRLCFTVAPFSDIKRSVELLNGLY